MRKNFTSRGAVVAVALTTAAFGVACTDDDDNDATTDVTTGVTTDLDPGAGSGLPGDAGDETTTTTAG